MDASRAHLMPTDQKASYTIVKITLNSTIRYLRCTVAEVSTPPQQYSVLPVTNIRPCVFLTGLSMVLTFCFNRFTLVFDGLAPVYHVPFFRNHVRPKV
jgi:hypothetical protein